MLLHGRVFIGAAVFLLMSCGRQPPEPVAESLRNKNAAVFVFLAPDCPLSQKYTRTLNDLRMRFLPDGIEFYGVFAGQTAREESAVDDFVTTYQIRFPVLLDADFRLADFFSATKTPEVVALDPEGRTIYRGAIDNWAPELGRQRTVITEHYLLDAMDSLVQRKDVRVKQTQAVGCFIERNPI